MEQNDPQSPQSLPEQMISAQRLLWLLWTKNTVQYRLLRHCMFWCKVWNSIKHKIHLYHTKLWRYVGHMIYICSVHSVESPSMVDPQWNIRYWGSKWNLHTVCWDAVGCEWGTASVYFGITYVCFIPSRLPLFALSHSTDIKIFNFCEEYH